MQTEPRQFSFLVLIAWINLFLSLSFFIAKLKERICNKTLVVKQSYVNERGVLSEAESQPLRITLDKAVTAQIQ